MAHESQEEKGREVGGVRMKTPKDTRERLKEAVRAVERKMLILKKRVVHRQLLHVAGCLK